MMDLILVTGLQVHGIRKDIREDRENITLRVDYLDKKIIEIEKKIKEIENE